MKMIVSKFSKTTGLQVCLQKLASHILDILFPASIGLADSGELLAGEFVSDNKL